MAAKVNTKDKYINFAYSIGAAIVIIGALFKINHYEFGVFNGTNILAFGLITEAIIFVISAFDPPAGEYEWEKAYPELAESIATERKAKTTIKAITEPIDNVSLSKKLDDMLKEAKIDSSVMEGLKNSFDKLGSSVDILNQSQEEATKFNTELSKLSTQITSLNKVYEGMLNAMQNNNNNNKG